MKDKTDIPYLDELLSELRAERTHSHELMVMLRRILSRLNAQNKKLFEEHGNAAPAARRQGCAAPEQACAFGCPIGEAEGTPPQSSEELSEDDEAESAAAVRHLEDARREYLAEKAVRLKDELAELVLTVPEVPAVAAGSTPAFETFIIEDDDYNLIGITEYEFRQLLRRDFPACVAECYIKRTLAPDFFAAIVRYYQDLADTVSGPITEGLEEAARREKEEEEAAARCRLKPTSGPFVLRGRHHLEKFLNEQVVEIVNNYEAYHRFGIDFPQSFLLEGDPGCGKTYAVERLAEHLGWNVVRVTSAMLGSSLIHETSCKIEELFKEAAEKAPSLIIMDELDAFVPNRAASSEANTYIKEEVGSFLKCLQQAASQRVLVVGMTNIINCIDPALLRSGRLGTHLHVEMPSAEEVEEVLTDALAKRPHDDFALAPFVQRLTGCPLADVARAVDEAAMHAARSKHMSVTVEDMRAGLDRIEECRITAKQERKPIGFAS